MMPSIPGQKPTASGSFADRPFAHILVYLHQKKLHGSLVVREGQRSAEIYFDGGLPTKVRSSTRGRELGLILTEMGAITEAQYQACLQEMARHGGLQGKVLLAQRAVTVPVLSRALREQIMLKLVDVFSMVQGNYLFYEGLNLLEGFGSDEPLTVDLEAVLMAGVRLHGDRLDLEPVLHGLQSRWLSVADSESLRLYRMIEAEREVCLRLLERPHRFEELLANDRLELPAVKHVAYVLCLTKLLTITDERPAIAPAVPEPGTTATGSMRLAPTLFDSIPPPPPATGRNPEVETLRQKLEARAEKMATQDYFELLGVSRQASHEEVQRAFVTLAREFHPDRASRPGLGELRESFNYVFSNIAEAHRTLMDPASRAEYEKSVAEGLRRVSEAPPPEEDAEVQAALEAEMTFQKAMVVFKRGDLKQTLDLVDRATQLAPHEPEYRALLAWVTAAQRPPDADVSDLVAKLRKAQEQSPRSERINQYLAMLLKRAGNESEAETVFRRVLELNVHNIDAARELRLIEVRREKEKEKSKGLFGKLLGKK